MRVVSGDEFEELADSLNNMGRRLELQFTTLAALSHIDRLIIARSETAPILEALLGQLIDRFDADSAAVVVFDRNTSHQARSHTLKRGDAPHEIREERLVVSAPERSLLFLHDQGFAVRLDERTMPALDVLGEHGHDAAFVFLAPERSLLFLHDQGFAVRLRVIFDDKLYGALALGFDDHEQSDSVDRSAVRDFAGRLAVAFRARDRERELYHRAHYDDLTKLPNRQLFGDRLQREIVHARRAKSLVAVLFLDVDRFKHANDTLGHSFGDELLRRIAERLTSSVRETDTVARLGGDEFTIVLVGAATPTKVVNLARAIPKRLAQPFFIDGREYFTSTSLGVAFYPQDGSTAAELLKNADTVMCRGKERGGAQLVCFEEAMNADSLKRMTLAQDLYRALERQELFLVFQPIVDLGQERVVSAEALLRWEHPERGLLTPDKFVPLAEGTGLITEIGSWVIEEALSRWHSWYDEGLDVDEVSVNVSLRQFQNPDFLQDLRKALERQAISSGRLELEVTESLLADESAETTQLTQKLRAMGVNLAIDDFGTGFSSLSYLQRFRFYTLKIDRSFVRRVHASREAAAIVRSIIELAHALGKKVVAEGVETADELEFLRSHGCDEVQGYYYSRALKPRDFVSFVKRFAATSTRTEPRTPVS